MTAPPKENVSLFICDDIRKEEHDKLSMLGIYYNRVVSIPKSENSDEVIFSLCFVITLNATPADYPISFEILDKHAHNSIFKSPDEILTVKKDYNYGIFAAKLGNIKHASNHESDYIFNLRILDREYKFPFILNEV